jgi:adenylate kinase
MNTFIFMGRPGCGKGMQARLLSEKTGISIFSTGVKLREIAASQTDAAKKVKRIIDSGDLMPSWFVTFLYQQILMSLKPGEGVIFEGVGRRKEEVVIFNEICEWFERDYRVIYLEVSEKSVTDRLLKRKAQEGRVDDDPYKLETRFKNYEKYTVPALDYFRSVGKVVDIDGEPLPDVVFSQVWKAVSPLIND